MTPASVLAASPYPAIGFVIFAITILVVVVYALVNVLSSGKRELGSEIEVAPNRKPYYDDEELEGPKLERTQFWAMAMLVPIAIGLPLYWVMEPGRQENAADRFNEDFVKEGAALFAPTSEGGYNCAGCHGAEGVGGVTEFNQVQPDGSIEVVTWKAPALNTALLRFSREEIDYILTYGRPFSPMPAWGLEGGGPLNDQQIQNLIDYMESIQISAEEAQEQAREQLANMMQQRNPDGSPVYASEGEALFNMGLTDAFAGGAYACGRCHSAAWSYSTSLDQLPAPGCGAFGPSLCDGSTLRQFPGELAFTGAEQQVEFVTTGSEDGVRYGQNGQGSGRMPGFGLRPAEPALYWINDNQPREPGPGMLPADLIEKIVEYERSL